MQSPSARLVVLATGGTIAGCADSAHDSVGYRAAQLGVADLLRGLVRQGLEVETEQLAQLDSKDMDPATWQLLARRCAHHLDRPEVQGLVVTHGTDTLEETAWLLHRVLAPRKPLVLTAAMRPSTSLQADGPQNLVDAMTVAGTDGAAGVLVLLAGCLHGAADVRKLHSHRLDAFSSGDAGPIAQVIDGRVRRWRDWPQGEPLGLGRLQADVSRWPWVEIVTSHAGARAAGVDALVAAGVQGLVVAGTGNASLHHELAAALSAAVARGVAVRVASRCALGPVLLPPGSPWLSHGASSAWQMRVELLLDLLADKA